MGWVTVDDKPSAPRNDEPVMAVTSSSATVSSLKCDALDVGAYVPERKAILRPAVTRMIQ